jgi:hypothetical protein
MSRIDCCLETLPLILTLAVPRFPLAHSTSVLSESQPDVARVEQLLQSYGMELLRSTALVMSCAAARVCSAQGIARHL